MKKYLLLFIIILILLNRTGPGKEEQDKLNSLLMEAAAGGEYSDALAAVESGAE